MAKPPPEEPKRLNRTVEVGAALNGVLDGLFRKRGFATRDILANWASMAPKPYDRLAIPDQLKWPRGAGHEGATLYLRCAEGQRLALAHEGAQIAAAVNRYFGYFLVRDVRLSVEPFRASSAPAAQPLPVSPEIVAAVGREVAKVEDDALRDALAGLGRSLRRPKR